MTSKIVCNAGPIIAFSMVGRLDILKGLFGRVLVPESIHGEVMEGGENNTGLAQYRNAHWIEVEKVDNSIFRWVGQIGKD
jgi:predicted nucleic acid-binding protein